MLKSPKTKTLADRLIERTSSICKNKQDQKPCIKTKKVIDREKKSKALSEVKPFENLSKNPLSFLKIGSMQKEVLLLLKLQGHVYE